MDDQEYSIWPVFHGFVSLQMRAKIAPATAESRTLRNPPKTTDQHTENADMTRLFCPHRPA